MILYITVCNCDHLISATQTTVKYSLPPLTVFPTLTHFHYICCYLRFHAEHTVGLPKIYKALKAYHETHSERYWLKPSKLLISVIESQATLKEEMYFRKQNKLEIQKQKEALEKAAKEKAEIEKEETVTPTDSA